MTEATAIVPTKIENTTNTENTTNIGIKSTGENINWRYLNEERVDDPIISALTREATSLYITNTVKNEENKYDIMTINIYIEYLNKYLKDNGIKKVFSKVENKIEIVETNKKDKNDKKYKKEKVKELSSKDKLLLKIKEEHLKKDMNSFVENLIINENYPIQCKKDIDSYFIILNWSVYLVQNKKREINVNIYLNNAISLYRAINECEIFLYESLKKESIEILNDIESIIYSKNFNSKNIFNILNNNLLLIIDCFWDKMKPKSIVLYQEQKNIISLVTNNLNNKNLIFYEMPPANGKTVLSGILAKIIHHVNKKNIETIPGYKRKTLLYICYNTIVRNEVAKLCITNCLDIKYWLAVTKMDRDDGSIKTFLRPYKNCYPDWNKKRTKKDKDNNDAMKWMRTSSNIYDQWKYYLNETRSISNQTKEIKDLFNPENLPEMIISDLDSAYTLLTKFPDTFVTYFDEAFACSNLEITSKIMSKMGHTVLVSATLSKPEEIPSVINNYRSIHNLVGNDFIHEIKSTKQHISCTFINEEGNIFTPHEKFKTIEELRNFIPCLNIPLIRRAYSPEVVFNYSKEIDSLLPNELKFNNKFTHIGMINHESLRDYLCEILEFISTTNNEELFQKMNNIQIKKIENMDVNTIFTDSAIHYQYGKTLHVATNNGFNKHVRDIATPFLNGSPKIFDVKLLYKRETEQFENQIKNLENNGDKDSEFLKSKLYKELDNVKLKWPHEFILNTKAHANKHGNLPLLQNSTIESFAKISDLNLFDDIQTKLLFSGIGIYQPETFNDQEMDFFLRKKDSFKFIISTPSIVYGTNISLSIIDIDSSFIVDSSKNILYQLIGRAGRKGKSHSATIIFRNDEMLNMILENNIINIEAQQIEHNFSLLLQNI
jgi:hypothetical protein